jgi:hypothetical protein
MPARDGVLGTYELLERIIASSPAESIEPLKLVCKTWYSLITNSRRIQRASVLKPLPPPSAFGLYASGKDPYGGLRYNIPTDLRLHPLLAKCVDRNIYDGAPGRRVIDLTSSVKICRDSWEFLVSQPIWAEMRKVKDDYISILRCEAVRLNLSAQSDGFWEYTNCVVCNPQGLRMSDVMEVAWKLVMQIEAPHIPGLTHNADMVVVFEW